MATKKATKKRILEEKPTEETAEDLRKLEDSMNGVIPREDLGKGTPINLDEEIEVKITLKRSDVLNILAVQKRRDALGQFVPLFEEYEMVNFEQMPAAQLGTSGRVRSACFHSVIRQTAFALNKR